MNFRVVVGILLLVQSQAFAGLESYNAAPQLLDRLGLRPTMEKFTGKGVTIAMLDGGICFETPSLCETSVSGGGKVELVRHRTRNGGSYVFPVLSKEDSKDLYQGGYCSHGSVIARILSGAPNESRQRTGIAVGAGLQPFSFENETVFYTILNLTHDVRIVNISRSGLTLTDLHAHRAGRKKIKDKVIVASAGTNTDSTRNVETTLEPQHGSTSRFNHLIVTVAVDPNNELTRLSRSCGGAQAYCLAIPSPDFPAKAAPVVSGMVALLMEEFPGLTASTYVKALLETASDAGCPSPQTGVGLPNMEKARNYLRKMTE